MEKLKYDKYVCQKMTFIVSVKLNYINNYKIDKSWEKY